MYCYRNPRTCASSTFLSSIVIFRKIIRHIPASLIWFCIYVRYNFCLSKNGKLIHWLLTCRKKGKRGCRFIPGVSIKKKFGEGGVCPRSFFLVYINPLSEINIHKGRWSTGVQKVEWVRNRRWIFTLTGINKRMII